MITIMGATGATGGALLRRLIELDIPCRAISRAPDGLRAAIGAQAPVEVVGADAADPRALRAAFDGSTQLFLAMANSPRQVALEINAVDAAAACGVRHVVKLSAPAAEPDSPVAVSRGHWQVEAHLAATGMVATLLRPYAFMQKLLLNAPAVAEGVLVAAMRDVPCNYIDVRDIADVAAEILLRPGLDGVTYTLTGPRAFSCPELAHLLGELTGRRVRHIDLPPDDFHGHLVRTAHLPDWLASHVVEIQRLAVARPESPNGTVEAVLGRPARTLDAFLREHRAVFAPGI
ncbi:NmrA family NAD(P)-binding protein [Streptomyces sp. BE308]|uniref:NmrA family NAD(P)-binding protein n=1 Tax=Streptomyces sp. BE308 TaxID=3002529 RepID=UPI002E77D7A0|nr:NmrA family NAD(P)-binding protein [Streptomyces sp. BE308]MEE1797098.1 NmrA family NAD(P)-binding protein [Streptomyces sp. BE308]